MYAITNPKISPANRIDPIINNASSLVIGVMVLLIKTQFY